MLRTAITTLLLVAGSLVTATAACANGYATDNRGNIYRVSPETKKFKRLGTVVVRRGTGAKAATYTPVLTDLALSTEHGLYGISYLELFKIDVTDPSRSTSVGLLGGALSFNALAFDSEGKTLYAMGSDTLYRVDLKTGAAKAIGVVGSGGFSDGDLAFIGGVLYGTFGHSGGSHLVKIDPKTGKGKEVGVIRRVAAQRSTTTPKRDAGTAAGTPIHSVWGLIWDGQKTWALTQDGHVLQLDLKTARATPQFRTPINFYGACPMLRL